MNSSYLQFLGKEHNNFKEKGNYNFISLILLILHKQVSNINKIISHRIFFHVMYFNNLMNIV